MTEIVPLKVISPVEVARQPVNFCFINYGLLVELLTSNLGCFTYNLLVDVCKIMLIQSDFTTTPNQQRKNSRKVQHDDTTRSVSNVLLSLP